MKPATGYLGYVSHFFSKHNFLMIFSSYGTCHMWFPFLLYGWRTLCLCIYKSTGICVVCSLGFSPTIPLLIREGPLFPYPSRNSDCFKYQVFYNTPPPCCVCVHARACMCVCIHVYFYKNLEEDTGGTLCHHFPVYSLETGFIGYGGKPMDSKSQMSSSLYPAD